MIKRKKLRESEEGKLKFLVITSTISGITNTELITPYGVYSIDNGRVTNAKKVIDYSHAVEEALTHIAKMASIASGFFSGEYRIQVRGS